MSAASQLRRIDAQLAALDARAARPAAELVADPHDTDARRVLDDILQQKSALREQRRSITKGT